jgi:hypothetical protein
MERAMQTLNVADKTIEVRTLTEKKTGKVLWLAYLVDKPNNREMRLCCRDNRKDCLDFVDRFTG